MNNHERYKKYKNKLGLLGLEDIFKVRLLDDDEVVLEEVIDKESDGKLVIPSFITGIENRDSLFKSRRLNVASSEVLKGCNFSEIVVEMGGGNSDKVLDLSGLCNGLESEHIKLDIISNRDIKIDGLFKNCIELERVDLSIKGRVLGMNSVFRWCENLKVVDIECSDTSYIKDIGYMFDGCSSISSIDMSIFKSNKIEYMDALFSNCHELECIDLSMLDLSEVKSMSWMFNKCVKLNKIKFGIQHLNKLETMDNMFRFCNGLESIDMSGLYFKEKDGGYGNKFNLSGVSRLKVNDTYKYADDRYIEHIEHIDM